MKLIIRTILLLFALSFALTAVAQTSAQADKAHKAPKAAKARKHKKSDAAVAPVAPVAPANNGGASVTPAPAPAVAPVAPAPGGAADGTTVIDPVTGQAVPAVLTTIAFEEVSYDFGKIKEGEVVKHKFKFTNTGTNNLILENVKPSCGCTALDWPKEPIAPGKSSEIEAQFNSSGKSGPQTKYITITLNSAERLERITFTGDVIPKPVDPANPVPAAEH